MGYRVATVFNSMWLFSVVSGLNIGHTTTSPESNQGLDLSVIRSLQDEISNLKSEYSLTLNHLSLTISHVVELRNELVFLQNDLQKEKDLRLSVEKKGNRF